VTLYVILLHRPSAPVTPVLGIQKVIRMAAEGFYRREVDGTPYFDFSDEKFMFKRTWEHGKLCFEAPEMIRASQNNLPLA